MIRKVVSLASVDSIYSDNSGKRSSSAESISYSSDGRTDSRTSRSSSFDLIFTLEDVSMNKVDVYKKLKSDFKKNEKVQKRRKRDQSLTRETIAKSPSVSDILSKYFIKKVRSDEQLFSPNINEIQRIYSSNSKDNN